MSQGPIRPCSAARPPFAATPHPSFDHGQVLRACGPVAVPFHNRADARRDGAAARHASGMVPIRLIMALWPLARGLAQRQARNGAQVILELAGDRAFDGPVPGVVHPRRHFVGDQASARDEEFDGQHADVAEMFQHRQDMPAGQAVQRARCRNGARVSRRMPPACRL